MKLNHDCIRDILFTIEKNTDFETSMIYPGKENEYSLLSSYPQMEVLYHIKQCKLEGLVTKIKWYVNGSCNINDLSPYGHKYLSDIRLDTNWNKIKAIAKNVGFKEIMKIASTLTVQNLT
jgi:hypothetical protein